MINYSEEVFRRAEAILSARRKAAEKEQKIREDDIIQRSPEILKMRNELKKTGLRLMLILKEGVDIDRRTEQLKQDNLKLQNDMAVLLEAFTGDRDYLKTKYTCTECNDTGFCEGRRCRCFDELLRKLASEQLTLTCGIELHDFSEFRTDIYPTDDGKGNNVRDYMKKVVNECIGYCENFTPKSPSLLFIGKTGLGKTYLSSCIAKRVAEKGFSVIFGSVSIYMRQIEAEHFGRESGNTLALVENCDLLILDDLGSEFRSQFYDATLYEIVNSRINSGRPTIISSNYTNSELHQEYNERIVSRLMGYYAPIWFRGNDIRQLIRKF